MDKRLKSIKSLSYRGINVVVFVWRKGNSSPYTYQFSWRLRGKPHKVRIVDRTLSGAVSDLVATTPLKRRRK